MRSAGCVTRRLAGMVGRSVMAEYANIKKKPPLLMRERKRDYAGACGLSYLLSWIVAVAATRVKGFFKNYEKNMSTERSHPKSVYLPPLLLLRRRGHCLRPGPGPAGISAVRACC